MLELDDLMLTAPDPVDHTTDEPSITEDLLATDVEPSAAPESMAP